MMPISRSAASQKCPITYYVVAGRVHRSWCRVQETSLLCLTFVAQIRAAAVALNWWSLRTRIFFLILELRRKFTSLKLKRHFFEGPFLFSLLLMLNVQMDNYYYDIFP